MSKIREGLESVRSLLPETSSLIQEKRSELAQAIGWPLLGYILIHLLFVLYVYSVIDPDTVDDDSIDVSNFLIKELLVYWFFSGLITLLIAVRTHRVLIDHSSDKKLTNTQSYIRFSIRLISLFIIFGLCFFPYSIAAPHNGDSLISKAIVVIGGGVSLVLVWYLSRLSLSLPSIAVGVPMNLGESHDRTKDHKLLMFFVVIILPFVLSVSLYSAADLIEGFDFIYNLLVSLIAAFLVVVEVAFLSVAYIKINRESN